MAIRLTDDEPQFDDDEKRKRKRKNNNEAQNSSSNASPIVITLSIIVALFYAFFSDDEDNSLEQISSNLSFSTGCSMSEEVYDKAYAFEPLDMLTGDNQIPTKASLREFIPSIKSQGSQGSCVGWATAYAARTIIEARETGENPNTIVFSPAFMYNQIRIDNNCEGAYIHDALNTMKKVGAVPLSVFPYDANSCTKQPSSRDMKMAKDFTIQGFTRLSKSGNNHDVDMDAMKQHLAKGAPIVIGMSVPDSFDEVADLWEPTSKEKRNVRKYGGHAMCVIAYDENKYGGAFQLMNSWGSNWGNKGLTWVKYEDFKIFTREAYAITVSQQYDNIEFEEDLPEDYFNIQLGLWLRNKNKGKYIALEQTASNVFENTKPLKKGDSFKIGVNNGNAAYIYIFGVEATGESYVLFPYAKTSPYFNITGSRLFPKDKSFTVDDVGNKDYMAIVISKEELDAAKLNMKINNSRKSTYAARVTEALGNKISKKTDWDLSPKGVSFDGENNGKTTMLMIFGIHKQ